MCECMAQAVSELYAVKPIGGSQYRALQKLLQILCYCFKCANGAIGGLLGIMTFCKTMCMCIYIKPIEDA